MIYLQLFISFLQIGAFSFGGGYAAMPLIQNQVVQLHPWLTQSEFTDLITISQMTPGPIAVNSATFVGTRIAGMPGALAATAGCVLPSCILVTLLAKIYLKYRNLSLLQGVLKSLRPAVIAMIAAAGASILVNAFWGESIASLTASQLLPNHQHSSRRHFYRLPDPIWPALNESHPCNAFVGSGGSGAAADRKNFYLRILLHIFLSLCGMI